MSTAADVRVPLIVEDRILDVPTVQARVNCGSGNRTGTGQFVVANDVNNPILIKSTLNFSWEQRPRTNRVTRVVAGLGLQAAMRQALDTLGTYDVYGLLFDFDSAKLRPETAQLVREIAVMLQQNPNWTILIAGHTNSIGGAEYNMQLSEQRAASVKQALISNGVAPNRLQSVGHGMSKPKADNSTLAGRAINRRVNSAGWIASRKGCGARRADGRHFDAVKHAASQRVYGDWDVIDAHLSRRDWLVGQSPTVADALLLPMARWGALLERPTRNWSNIQSHLARVSEWRPAVAALAAQGLKAPT